MMNAEECQAGERAVLERTLGRVAHDVRGPAGVAAGALVELERALVQSTGSAEYAQLLQMVHRSLARLLRTADRYAFTAEALHGLLALQREAIDPAELISTAASETARVFARRGVSLEVLLPPDLHKIHADRRWLTVGIGECVAVALRYARSRVTVRAAETRDTFESLVEYDAETHPHSFDRFDPRADGDVLALALARDAAAAHGGTLTTEHHASGCTTLKLSIALKPEHASER